MFLDEVVYGSGSTGLWLMVLRVVGVWGFTP